MIARLARFEIMILVLFFRNASTKTITTATTVIKYIDMLISLELLVFSNFIVCGIPDAKNSTAGR